MCPLALEVALEWYLINLVSSDVELALLSNVCRSWRNRVAHYVLQTQRKGDSNEKSSTAAESTTSLLSSMIQKPKKMLLLTSMVAECMRRTGSAEDRSESTFKFSATTRSQTVDSALEKDKSAIPEEGGHEINNNIPLQEQEQDETFCAVWLHSEGIQEVKLALCHVDDYVPSMDSLPDLLKRDRHKNRTRPRRVELFDEEKKNFVVCTDSWYGYRNPFEVLKHFGYTRSFVDSIFENFCEDDGQEDIVGVTYAVRGATVGRPESYCLCKDTLEEYGDDDATIKLFQSEDLSGVMDDVEEIRQRMDVSEEITLRLRSRYDLEREVLPRVEKKPLLDGSRQRCVQFLNASKGNAVCMMTPPFACGPIAEPITVIVVGIATEDGCFLSGLRTSLEIGHLHPEDSRIETTELSPVCVATRSGSKVGPARPLGDPAQSDNDDDDESVEAPCKCAFNGVTENFMNDPGGDVVHKYRGKSGPGQWHCYTFIVQGNESQIRIDGVKEPVKVEIPKESSTYGCGILDGLTIGSDFCFEVPLCSGAGSDGDGEAAIAEIAIFAGALPEDDVRVLEESLMTKFGITKPQGPLWVETDFERKAEALYRDPEAPYWEGGVPLRYMSRHRTVGWQLSSPVTGLRSQVKKIGCRPGVQSSDWDE